MTCRWIRQNSPRGAGAIAVSQYTSIAGNIVSRFSLFYEKGRPKSLAFAEMRKCRLLGRDSVSPGWCRTKIASSGRSSASSDSQTRGNGIGVQERSYLENRE